MAASSVPASLRACTIKEKARIQNNTENVDQIDLLSSPATIDVHGLYADLVESAEVDQENNNNNNNKNSCRRKNQKDLKRLQGKSILSSSENVSSGDINATTLSRRSSVWKYAIREAKTDYSICSLCADNKRISSNNGSTSTLRKHLISVHKLHHLALPPKKSEVQNQQSA